MEIDYTETLKSDKIGILMLEQNDISRHSHDYYEMVYIKEGSITHCINGNRIILKKGDYFIIDVGDFHSYEAIEGEKCILINCLFYPELIDKTLYNRKHFVQILDSYLIKFDENILKFSPTAYLFSDEDGEILSLIEKIYKELSQHRHGYSEVIRCYLVEILINTLRKIIDDEKSMEKDSPVKYLMKYVADNYAGRISLSDLSKKLNYSLAYVSRKFKEDTGMLFSEYLQKTRVYESLRMLANTDKKISEIAGEVGYDDVKYYVSVFKRVMSCTPSEYRKNNK